jgi:hypothetical protein
MALIQFGLLASSPSWLSINYLDERAGIHLFVHSWYHSKAMVFPTKDGGLFPLWGKVIGGKPHLERRFDSHVSIFGAEEFIPGIYLNRIWRKGLDTNGTPANTRTRSAGPQTIIKFKQWQRD